MNENEVNEASVGKLYKSLAVSQVFYGQYIPLSLPKCRSIEVCSSMAFVAAFWMFRRYIEVREPFYVLKTSPKAKT